MSLSQDRSNRIKDKATLRWCLSYVNSVGCEVPYQTLEEFVSDGWCVIILLGTLNLTSSHVEQNC